MMFGIIIRLPSWGSENYDKNYACQYKRGKRHGFDLWVRRRKQQSTPVFFPRKSHEEGSLAGYSPRSCKESGTAKHTLTNNKA